MDKCIFWRIIETTKAESSGDLWRQADLVVQELARHPPEEIYHFYRILGGLLCALNTWDMFAAAYLAMETDCSSDDFDYFQGWLVAQGETAFQAVLENPEALLYVVGNQRLCETAYKGESILEAAFQAYELSTGGKEFPEDTSAPCEMAGERCAEADLPWKYPALWARYGRNEWLEGCPEMGVSGK